MSTTTTTTGRAMIIFYRPKKLPNPAAPIWGVVGPKALRAGDVTTIQLTDWKRTISNNGRPVIGYAMDLGRRGIGTDIGVTDVRKNSFECGPLREHQIAGFCADGYWAVMER